MLRALRSAATWAAPGVIAPLIRAWGRTGRVRLEGLDAVARDAAPRPAVYALWHDQLLTMLIFLHFRVRRLGVLISRHPDAEAVTRAAGRLGLDVVRGSSTRGGAEAIARLVRYARDGGSLVFMPDGPKGPRHRASPGVLVLAQRAGVPVVPVGCAAAPVARMGSWDRMQVPAPFARMAAVGGAPVRVPEGAQAADRERLRLALERELDVLTARAEARVR